MNNLNVALSILISSGIDLSRYIGIIELSGHAMSKMSAQLIDHASTEYDLEVEIYKINCAVIAAYIPKIGWFQLID